MAPRILIVEDEPLVALDLKEILEEAGFEVPRIVDTADGVMQAVQAVQPALILMDIRLRSFLDGIDAVTRLRLLSKAPVVFLTAFSTPDILKRVEALKPAAFLLKPVDAPLLVSTLRKALQAPGLGA